MGHVKPSVIILAFLTIQPGLVSATNIDVSNLLNTPTGKTPYSPSANTYMASMFQTSSYFGTASPIASITLRLQNASGVSITNAQVHIYTSTLESSLNLRRPNTPIPNASYEGTISAINPNGSGSLTYQDVTFAANAPIVLSANTPYWIVFLSTPSEQVSWLHFNTSNNVVGFNAEITPYSATSTLGTSGSWIGFSSLPNQFGITTVPEPSTYVLCTIAAVTWGGLTRRRRRTASP